MLDRTAPSVEDEQPRATALGRRLLSDQLIGQVEPEIGHIHAVHDIRFRSCT
jgi:hypothetical protein